MRGVAQLIAQEDVHINKDNGESEVKLVRGADNTYRVKVVASAMVMTSTQIH